MGGKSVVLPLQLRRCSAARLCSCPSHRPAPRPVAPLAPGPGERLQTSRPPGATTRAPAEKPGAAPRSARANTLRTAQPPRPGPLRLRLRPAPRKQPLRRRFRSSFLETVTRALVRQAALLFWRRFLTGVWWKLPAPFLSVRSARACRVFHPRCSGRQRAGLGGRRRRNVFSSRRQEGLRRGR